MVRSREVPVDECVVAAQQEIGALVAHYRSSLGGYRVSTLGSSQGPIAQLGERRAGSAKVAGSSPAGSIAVGVEPEEWRTPSRQLLTLRRLEVGVPALLVAVALAVAGALSGSGVAYGFAAAALIVGALLWRFVGRRFGSWGYAEREEDLLIRRGVMFARLSVVPYGRMQFIDVTAGPLERAFGLATVRLHTAAAATDARIPGLEREEAATPPRQPGRARRGAGGRPVKAGTPEGWQRLHPLSPVVRGGRATIAIFILLIPIAFGGDTLGHATPQFAVIAVIVLAGFVSWLVTRWRIEDDDLRIETGLLRRQSLRFPLAQVQAIDVVRPGLARLFRVAELRLRMAGSSGGTARLAYVAEHEVEPLRDQLLALARGARHDEAPAAELERPLPEEHVLATVGTGPLVASILLENWWLVLVLVGHCWRPGRLAAHGRRRFSVGGGFVWALSTVTFVWRRFNQQYRLTVAEGPDGLHLRGGLVALTAEVIRPGRVQAVRPCRAGVVAPARLVPSWRSTSPAGSEGRARARHSAANFTR